MKKTETLKKNYEFKNVMDRGKLYLGKYICVYVLKNNQQNKIGIAVSKKAGNAVWRNKIKRWIKESDPDASGTPETNRRKNKRKL